MYELGYAASGAVTDLRWERGRGTVDGDPKDVLEQFLYLSLAARGRDFEGGWEKHLGAIKEAIDLIPKLEAAKELLESNGFVVSRIETGEES